MKQYRFFLVVIFFISFLACTKEENSYFTPEPVDMKAAKMEQMGNLFDAIARQPEAFDQLMRVAEMSYSDYTQLLPLSDKAIEQRGKARGIAFGLLFSSIARQPEAYLLLDSAAMKFFGPYNADYISSELSDVTKIYASAALLESIARQPQADSLFNAVSKRYLNYEINLDN